MGTSRQHVAVSLSGGGHRATLFGLGALLYLVDAGKGPELAAISSISGGSLANGYLGLSLDITTATPDQFEHHAKTLARRVALRGTLWASWLTYAFLAALAAILVAAVLLTLWLDAVWSWVVWPVAVLLVGVLAQRRSWVACRSFDRTLFRGATLSTMHRGLDHVVCATDLQTSEQVYFSSAFVYSWRTGFGQPAGMTVAEAVQASAALPGAFNPVTLPKKRHAFAEPSAFPRFRLTDGGVYDNMGTEWVLRLVDGFDVPVPEPAPRRADEVVVVNSSAGRSVTKRATLSVPILGEVLTLLAVKDVLYDQTTAVRRRLLNLRYRVADKAPDALADEVLHGATIQIDRSPYALADTYAPFSDERGLRAQAVIAALDGMGRERWKAEADANRSVKTTLSKVKAERAAALIHHAYVLTMANTHVLLDYPLLPMPGDARVKGWLE